MRRRSFLAMAGIGAATAAYGIGSVGKRRSERPNIIFIFADDHSSNALSCYGSKLIKTPNIDSIADEGVLFKNTFATNSICGPSRSSVLTGVYSHIHGTKTNYIKPMNKCVTYPELLKKEGYRTALIGKTHFRTNTNMIKSLDHYVLPHSLSYYDMNADVKGKGRKVFPGYKTDVLTDLAMEWIGGLDEDKPFMLMLHHPAPHMPFQGDDKLKAEFKDKVYPEPESFNDPDKNQPNSPRPMNITIPKGIMDFQGRKHVWGDRAWEEPESSGPADRKSKVYQIFMREFMNCIRSLDNNTGRMLKFLEESGLDKNTIVVYSSDQGFFLGDHGWYDKRLIYEESIRMPLLVRGPGIRAGQVVDELCANIDYAPTFLDMAGVAAPASMQGRSMLPLIKGKKVRSWRDAVYYQYFEDRKDSPLPVQKHYGIRTKRYKLIRFYDRGQHWELYDLKKDPVEMKNLYGDASYEDITAGLKKRLKELRAEFKDNNGPSVS